MESSSFSRASPASEAEAEAEAVIVVGDAEAEENVSDMEDFMDVPTKSASDLKTTEDALEYWNKALERDNLSSHHFRDWWRQVVPRLFSPSPNMDYESPQSHLDEEQIERQLISPLEWFLCNGRDPADELKRLSQLSDPPAQCGKLFKMGDPTYSCRDCGHDPTCVLCVDCFKGSEHRHHRYKISTSCGGGYCDCGDPEAWSMHPHCSTHILGLQWTSPAGSGSGSGSGSGPIDRLPPDVQVRARHVFSAVLRYAYEILTIETLLTLPGDLTQKESNAASTSLSLDDDHDMSAMDKFVAVVYNDEAHTYDEVIATLPRSVGVDRDMARTFATLIDREGRCVVKCADFQVCQFVKEATTRNTSRRTNTPLKARVMHGHVHAHQTFAGRLLAWLQSMLNVSAGFRAMFARIVLEPQSSASAASSSRSSLTLLEAICRHDTVLWKAMRTQMHHLLVSAMLMEMESKRAFARAFTKSYGHMMKDFAQDDHEHSFSITSLSVQLFTVPTLAHYLIAQEDVLAVLLRTFMSECECKRNLDDGAKGKLEFKRNVSSTSARRSFYILSDLKYLLATPPSLPSSTSTSTSSTCDWPVEWSDALRKGFLHGLSLLFDFLTWMQGMDAQVRQVNQHVEYELEWETAFNLHIKLAPIMDMALSWCGRDRVVYIKAMRMLFKKLQEDLKNTEANVPWVTREVCGIKADCVDYTVSSQAVSLHQPLTRLLAGLSLSLGKFGLTWDSHELSIVERPTVARLMEPSLRTFVLVSQVQAGMWRRNGYSLIEQVRVYHDPRCRKEMLDQDLIMLQLAAHLMPGDEYVIALLNKFQLNNWSNQYFNCSEDDSIRQVTTLVEEFLCTLIMVLGERHTPGIGQVTADDAVRKEIIQLLCIEPMSHSNLNKSLVEDVVRHDTGMDRVIDLVAVFKKPSSTSGMAKGIYELKPEYYDQYNVFFYHYTKEDQSKAEEAQHVRQAAAKLPQCNPPPTPPPFTKEFAGINKIMESKVFRYVLSLVLHRADNLVSRCFSENQVHLALHLIGLCLQEEERTKNSADEKPVEFTSREEEFKLLNLLEQLVGSQRIKRHKDLLTWTLRKWRALASNCGEANSMEIDSEELSSEAMQLQLQEDAEAEKKRRAAAAKAKMMAKMQAAQKTFMKENSQLFEDTASGARGRNESTCSIDMELAGDDELVALGPKRSPPVESETTFTCILCQEEEAVRSGESPALVMPAFVQRSTVMSKRRSSAIGDEVARPNAANDCPILPADLSCAPYTSSCGHWMHASCWQKYYDGVVSHERQRSRMRMPQNFDVEKQEFLCSLCRRLSNAVVPLIPQFHLLQPTVLSGVKKPDAGVEKERKPVNMSFSEWIQALLIALKYKRELKEPVCEASEGELSKDAESSAAAADNSLPPTAAAVSSASISADQASLSSSSSPVKTAAAPRHRFYTCPLDQVVLELDQLLHDSQSFNRLYTDHEGCELQFSPSVFEMMNLFSQTVFRTALNEKPALHDERIPMLVWQMCAFTIHSNVWALLDQGKSIFTSMSARQNNCLSSLVRFCGVVGSNFGEPKVIRSHSLRLLATLFEVDTKNMSVLEFDAFGLLVALTFCLPSLFNANQAAPLPSANIQDQYLMQLIFIVHLVQIILTTDQFSVVTDEEEEAMASSSCSKDKENCLPVLDLLQLVRESVGFAADGDGTEGLNASGVWQDLKTASLPFLRSCALFYHYLSDVPAPTDALPFEPNEFDVLARYLGLPTSPAKLLESTHLLGLARKWANHPNVHIMLSPSSSTATPAVTYPLQLNTLTPMPNDYSELINSVSTFKCPNSNSDESRVPAMCLVCGQVMCSQSYCCQSTVDGGHQVGACTEHAERCGAGQGIFLRIRECKVVLLSGKFKGCFIPPPYLDEYGETDIGLRRGNPLKLCPERLRKIHRLWFTHSIPEKIAYSVEGYHLPWQDL